MFKMLHFHVIDPILIVIDTISEKWLTLLSNEREKGTDRVPFYWTFGITHVEFTSNHSFAIIAPIQIGKTKCYQRANGVFDQPPPPFDVFKWRRVSNQTRFRLRKTWEGNRQHLYKSIYRSSSIEKNGSFPLYFCMKLLSCKVHQLVAWFLEQFRIEMGMKSLIDHISKFIFLKNQIRYRHYVNSTLMLGQR